MSISLDNYYYIEQLKNKYSFFRSLRPYTHQDSGFDIDTFKISFRTIAPIWDQYTNMEALKNYWDNYSQNSITVNFRLAKIDINNPLYSRLINPYICTISDMEKLKEMPKEKRFETYIVVIVLLRIIMLNTGILSMPNMDTYKINALEFPPREMLNTIFCECLKEFDYSNYRNEYKRYLEEFFNNGLDEYIERSIK